MPSPVDLTDLDAVRVFLQKEDINTDQDDIIQALITAASRAIAERFQREFVDSGAGATRKFLVEDLAPYWIEAGNVDLAPYDLNAGNPITVKIDPQDGGGITLTEWTDYVLKPLPTKHGVYMRIELLGPLPVDPNWRRGRNRAISVTGTWGFPEIPEDVQHWTNVVIATWLRKDVAAFSNVFHLDEGQVERASMLPGGAMAGLAHYGRDL
jgi:hypothetical protein